MESRTYEIVTGEERAEFVYEGISYHIYFCTECGGKWSIHNVKCECHGTSCNGGGCVNCSPAFEQWHHLGNALDDIFHKECIRRRKAEHDPEEFYYIGPPHYNNSFFDMLGMDCLEADEPVRDKLKKRSKDWKPMPPPSISWKAWRDNNWRY